MVNDGCKSSMETKKLRGAGKTNNNNNVSSWKHLKYDHTIQAVCLLKISNKWNSPLRTVSE